MLEPNEQVCPKRPNPAQKRLTNLLYAADRHKAPSALAEEVHRLERLLTVQGLSLPDGGANLRHRIEKLRGMLARLEPTKDRPSGSAARVDATVIQSTSTWEQSQPPQRPPTAQPAENVLTHCIPALQPLEQHAHAEQGGEVGKVATSTDLHKTVVQAYPPSCQRLRILDESAAIVPQAERLRGTSAPVMKHAEQTRVMAANATRRQPRNLVSVPDSIGASSMELQSRCAAMKKEVTVYIAIQSSSMLLVTWTCAQLREKLGCIVITKSRLNLINVLTA